MGRCQNHCDGSLLSLFHDSPKQEPVPNGTVAAPCVCVCAGAYFGGCNFALKSERGSCING